MNKKAVDVYFRADIKDSLVDFLLENGIEEFYYFDCKRYSLSSFLKSDKEQVSGRMEFGLFKFFVDTQNFQPFLERIKAGFKEGSIKIFQIDVTESL